MKKFLFLILISFIISKEPTIIEKITDIIKCLSKSNLLKPSIERIIEAINSKDISLIFNTCITIYNQLKDEINNCKKEEAKELFKEKDEEYDDIKLGYPKYVYVLYTQIGELAFIWYDKGGKDYLKEKCHLEFGQRTWFCNYLLDK